MSEYKPYMVIVFFICFLSVIILLGVNKEMERIEQISTKLVLIGDNPMITCNMLGLKPYNATHCYKKETPTINIPQNNNVTIQ